MFSRPFIRLLATGAAVAASATVALSAPPTPAFAASLYSRCYGGAAYAVRSSDGALVWWGDPDPASNGGFTTAAPVGSGWGGLSRVVAGGGGVIYAVTSSGELLWYRHTDPTGGGASWASGSGKVIGPSGWNNFSQIIAAGDGVLFGVNSSNGNLQWYRYTDPVGGNGTWASGSGKAVGNGWSSFHTVFSGGAGILYAVRGNGELLWYRLSDPFNGSGGWSSNSIGTGWAGFTGYLSEGGGVIYPVRPDGSLGSYRHLDPYGGSASWTTNAPSGSGWGAYSNVTADPTACGTTDQSSIPFVKVLAREFLAHYGWSDAQFDPLDKLWERESNWRWYADNPSSHAYGIPQSLPATKMASAGSDWHDNPLTQVAWGLGYIKDRYGDPAGAWAHELSNGWY